SPRPWVVAQGLDASQARCLRPARTLVHGDGQLYGITNTKLLEFGFDHGVPVEVDPAAIGDFDEPIALIVENGVDLPLRLALVNLHLAVLLPTALLEPAFESGEAVPNRYQGVGVGIDVAGLATDCNLRSRHTRLDRDFELARARNRTIDVDVPCGDVVIALLKLVDVLADLGTDRL